MHKIYGISIPSVGVPVWGDHCNYNASGVVLHAGGNYNQNQNHGAFYLNGNNQASNSNANIGAHILEMARHATNLMFEFSPSSQD
jgi:hypothetical protein